MTQLRQDIKHVLVDQQLALNIKLQKVCDLIQSGLPKYDWVGFYIANQEQRTLHLKAQAGTPTDHTVIPFGKGICGQVAESNETFIVDDVNAQSNYIACSIHVKSEIVVPLFVHGENIGQIDIDSHTIATFGQEDQEFLEWVNQQVAKVWE